MRRPLTGQGGGSITKIETLAAIARKLDVTLSALLGVNYIPGAVAFFEQLRQMEARGDWIVGLFRPISNLLSTEAYDNILRDLLPRASGAGRRGGVGR